MCEKKQRTMIVHPHSGIILLWEEAIVCDIEEDTFYNLDSDELVKYAIDMNEEGRVR